MDWLSLAASGLVGAVLGSGVSLAGAFGLERWRRHVDELGAARALYFEMVGNATSLKRMSEGLRLTDLTRATWDVAQSKVATLLSPSDFMVVARSYGLLPHCEARIDSARASGVVTKDDQQFWASGAIGVLNGVIALKPIVWSDREHAVLEKAEEARDEAEGESPPAAGTGR
jgi:hypothetical protein